MRNARAYREILLDLSTQPVAPVPGRSSSVWNPLLKCTKDNTVPTLERWRGGLDTLLIFVGLFSAIVTAFLVESLKSLQPDEGARTNELLANLTDIIIALNAQHITASLSVKQPNHFVPSSSDIRVNICWSIALIISMSVAALAVAGRGALALLLRSEGDAAAQLTEIYQRWTLAKVSLGPFLEALPQVLLVPFALFVVGLLDTLFTASPEVTPITAASSVCAFIVAMVGALLCAAVLHGIRYPKVSPYQTSISRYMNSWNNPKDPETDLETSALLLPHGHEEGGLSSSSRRVYHLAVQEIFDDETLDQASAALEGVMHNFNLSERFYDQVEFPDLEFRTILHLLSPEGSFRSNLSAARMVQKLCLGPDGNSKGKYLYTMAYDGFSSYQRSALLTAVRRAAEHHLVNRPNMANESPNKILLMAMAALIPTKGRAEYPHPILTLLSANYLTRQPMHSVPPELVEAYKDTVWFGVSMLVRLLNIDTECISPSDHVKLDGALIAVIGPCTLQPEYGTEILLSMMNSPTMAPSTSYQDSVDYDMVAECLVRWVAGGENALNTAMAVVDQVLREYFNPDPMNYRPAHRSYLRAVHHVMMLVYQATRVSSPQSLLFCTKFILKVAETFIWDVGRFMTLRIISRFIVLWNENSKAVDMKDLRACREALTYAYRWTLYKASSFGEYDINVPEFQDTLPPREIFLSELRREWLRCHSDGNLETPAPVGIEPKYGKDATLMPLPLPGWGLDGEEDKRTTGSDVI
ncbi:hypothetical protein D9615_004424 [Tricholomella constricta]|uniref:DUF6535 domain-containing protein n=1 Tax=Tricholomella constricta TaxID=117010 RepID=A0A8H5HEL8_9AGAR|nr:hypothetical protein D9615_004424 [Tricholomella constricta]